MDRDDFQEDCAFSIIYSDSFETLNLVAYSPDEANIWVTGLRCLVDSEKGKNAYTWYDWQPLVFSPELPALFNPGFHGCFPFNQNFQSEFSATSSSAWNSLFKNFKKEDNLVWFTQVFINFSVKVLLPFNFAPRVFRTWMNEWTNFIYRRWRGEWSPSLPSQGLMYKPLD